MPLSGTTAVIVVLLTTVKEALNAPNVTDDAVVKSVPEIVTVSPAKAGVVIDDITGAISGASAILYPPLNNDVDKVEPNAA